ncbi:MAG: right-handed parallel beta-helix repeat-containing protein, partial [Opitutaceae bacterium]
NGVILEGGGGSHVRIENLSFRKIGTHGIHIRNGAVDVTVRDCDLTLIGGAVFRGDQFSRWYGERFVERRVRFGNAIETWADVAGVIIEGCRISEVFDGGICLQGLVPAVARNVWIHDNVIWNCGYDSFDVAHGLSTRNVVFEHNTCWNAGEGWALQGEPRPRYSLHVPDNVGYHCNLESKYAWGRQSELSIRRNIFANAPESRCFNYGPDQSEAAIVVDDNCYYQAKAADAIVQLGKVRFTAAEFAAYQQRSGWDQHSLVADPQFVDPAAGDFRLNPGSPCRGCGAQRSLEPRAAQGRASGPLEAN